MTDQTTDRTPDIVGGQLPRVEDALRAAVATDDALLTEMASHLIVAGGKRQRPLVALACGACASGFDGGAVGERIVQGAVSVELVHLGSLYHDDVIDEAEIRRQADSVNARWGNLRAILAGDFLLARASEIAASLATEIAGLLAATIADLCVGEVAELRTAFSTARTEEDYFASIGGKTAALFAAAARIGALADDQPREAVDALGHFGWCYGMAFQIVDDILDLTATEAQMGKPVGHDMAEGVYTLPVLAALKSSDELASLLGGPIGDDELARARKLVLEGGGVTVAAETASNWLDRADAALAAFSGSPGAATLVDLTARLRGMLDV
ncbi:MAG: polyprenyl synthetase family protein [Actinobacteria bacterium]|nr:polyprenyl synthetase family protein [Actinomycetota bacterium]